MMVFSQLATIGQNRLGDGGSAGEACLHSRSFEVRRQRRPGVATHKIGMRWGFIRHGAWMSPALGIIFIFFRGGRTQDEPASPTRTREALRQAIEFYKSQDYDKAASYFSYVQPLQQTLSPTDQQDFVKFSASNAIALKGWQDGTAQIRLAQDALQQGRTKDAGDLLKSLN